MCLLGKRSQNKSTASTDAVRPAATTEILAAEALENLMRQGFFVSKLQDLLALEVSWVEAGEKTPEQIEHIKSLLVSVLLRFFKETENPPRDYEELVKRVLVGQDASGRLSFELPGELRQCLNHPLMSSL